MSTAHIQMPKRAFRDLCLDQIEMTDLDLRSEVDEDGLADLSSSIEVFGTVLQPVLVSYNSKTRCYHVILGGRRVRAARQAGQETIPACIVDDMDNSTALVMMLVENMQRKDLDPLDESRGMARLRDEYHFDEDRIAGSVGRSLDFVRDRLALLELPGPIQRLIESEELGVGHAIAITRLAGKQSVQLAVAQAAVSRRLSGQVVERMVSEALKTQRQSKKPARRRKVKRTGAPLSGDHMNNKVQQYFLRGEQLVGFGNSLPMQRWSSDQAQRLVEATNAIEEDLARLKRRFSRRARKGS